MPGLMTQSCKPSYPGGPADLSPQPDLPSGGVWFVMVELPPRFQRLSSKMSREILNHCQFEILFFFLFSIPARCISPVLHYPPTISKFQLLSTLNLPCFS